jgi:predicted nucleotidyltransferase
MSTPAANNPCSAPYPALRHALNDHPYVHTAIVFGSVATGRARPDSDFDFAVQADGPLTASQKQRLIEDLALVTGRPVDLVDLSTAGVALIGQILKHGPRIRGTDAVYAELLSRQFVDAEDFLPYVRRMLAERRKAWKRAGPGARPAHAQGGGLPQARGSRL